MANPVKEFVSAAARLEKRNKSTVFVLALEERTHSTPIHSCTFLETADRLLHLRDADRLDLIIESYGGSPGDAYKIANILRDRGKKLVVYVPRFAKSAATLMCLIADEIRMCETAELGPLDMQVDDPRDSTEPMSALNGFKGLDALSQFTNKFVDDTVTVLQNQTGMKTKEAYAIAVDLVGIVSRVYEPIDSLQLGYFKQSLEVARQYGLRLIQRAGSKISRECVEKLVYGYPTHGFVIDYREAKAIGLPVRLVETAEDGLLRKMLDFISNIQYIGIPTKDDRLLLAERKSDAKPKDKTARRSERKGKKKPTGEDFPAAVSSRRSGA